MSDPEHDEDWQRFKLRYPEFFAQYEQPQAYKDLQDLLAYYGPKIAAVMAESLRAKEKAEDIQRKFNILMGVCAGLGIVSLASLVEVLILALA
jgi:hypothetical protein